MPKIDSENQAKKIPSRPALASSSSSLRPEASNETLVHAVAVAIAVDPDGPLAGALLLAPSGYGKSTLAMAAIENCPWRRSALIADDAVLLSRKGGRVYARAPQSIAGLIEVRGFGPARVRRIPTAVVIAGFDLAAPQKRLPEPEMRNFSDGIVAPVWPFQMADAPAARLRAALRSILGGQSW